MNLESKIEAILFFKGEPVSLKKLSDILKSSEEEVREGLTKLKENLNSRGVVLTEIDNEFSLGTAPELGDLIENLQKEELNKELSKAALETLSVVLYKNGANRTLIDYIRGVNSSFTLRALSIRGLVEKVIDPTDSRKYVYKPTLELLSYLGVKSIDELPSYTEVASSLEQAEKNKEEGINEA